MPFRPIQRLTALTASLTLLTACTANHAPDAGSQQPRSGGTLRFGLDYAPTCLDPQLVTGATPNLGLLDTLTAQDPLSGKIVAWLASSWQIDGTATTFTFHLRDGVTFSDGTPLNAAIVKTNYDKIVALGAKAGYGSQLLAGYRDATTPDERTLVVRFARPNAQFLQATSDPALGVVAAATLAKTPDQRCQGAIVGSGPFVLRSYRPNQEVVVVGGREGYDWAPASATHHGQAYLDKIDVTFVPESGTRTGSLASGQVDVIGNVLPQDEPRFDGNGFHVLSRIEAGIVLGLIVNENRPLLQDQKVRTALLKGINRGQIVKTSLTSRYKPATSVLSSTTPYYTDLSAELAYDPDGASALLEQDGWKVGADGIREKDGRKLTIDVIFGAVRSLELVQQQLRDIGVDLKLRQLDLPSLGSALSSDGYDLFLRDANRADPDVLRTLFSSTRIGAQNIADPELQNALDAQAATADAAKRAALVAEAQRQLVQHGHYLPINEKPTVVAAAATVHGLAFTAGATLTFYDTWLS
ncbi:ABC transporter substrate-binding protein [Kribbella kalugense]|uniref:Peptide/nickel transport system substrate-binding protein n=1 Tax=Kribbella kalugense TaxID=2512221 RepID=A0A4R8A112_9ACTN|nr:ABC transporter substrate-binding protein [Kribbella kalugense]TDW24187.1 peptide/nickel transport system substrate-binding protein [Kribbella kalugense]